MGGVALLAVLAALTLSHPSATRLHTWPWRGLGWLFWAAPVIWLALRCWLRQSLHAPNRLLASGLVTLAGATVASAFASPFTALSVPHVWPALGGAAWVFLVHDWVARQPYHRPLLARGFAGMGVVLVLVSLGMWAIQSPRPLWSHRNAFPFGHSTLTAGALVLALPWMGRAVFQSRRSKLIFWALAVLAALISLASTSSRGGLLAAGAMAAAAVALALLRLRLRRRDKILVLGVVLVFLALGVASNQRLREAALGGGWSEIARESNQQRVAMLEAGVALGARRPILGWGPGTVPLTYPTVRAELSGGADNVLQLHSTPAQVWATLGIGGIAAALLMIGGLAKAVRERFRLHDWSPIEWAALASLGGYAIFSLTDHQLDLPFMNLMVAANAALLVRPNPARGVRRMWALPALAALAVCAIPTGRDLLARRAYARGDVAAASRWMPSDPYYHHQTASRLALQGEVEQARQTLEASLAGDAHAEYARFNLGWLLLGSSPEAAARHFAAAAQLAPTRSGVYFGLGLAFREMGLEDAAVRSFAVEALNDPLAITAPFWEMPGMAPLRSAVLGDLDKIANEHPQIATRIAWIRWWGNQREAASPPAHAFSESSRAFIAALPQLEAHEAIAPLPYVWARLYRAWRASDHPDGWPAVTPDPELAAALRQRASRHPENFVSFLRAGTEDDPRMLKTWRRLRMGYRVLAFHPDGPPPVDSHVVQANRLMAELVPDLFPPKGALPASILIALLPDRALSGRR